MEGLGDSHQALQGLEAAPQLLPSSGAGKGPVSLDELQQASWSLAHTRVLCARRSPLCHTATDPNYFETAASAVMFIPNHPRYNSSLAQGDVHKGALLNVFDVKG